MGKYERLNTPGQIGSMRLKNRMIMPAMGTNLGNADGTVSDSMVNYYARRAEGGIGLVITEVCSPERAGICIPGEMQADDNKFMPGLSRIPNAVHANGGKVALQIAHAGCFSAEALIGERAKTPSGIGSLQIPGDNPRAMETEEIKELVVKYGEAARRAMICGFDAVEIHGAHGYLPLQFFSPYLNKRTDEYGGSLENRARFAIEVVRSVKEHTAPDFPVLYRMSGEEYVEGGFTREEAWQLAQWIEEAGADAIDVSAGTWDARIQPFFDVMEGKRSSEGLNLTNGIGTSVWVPSHYTPRNTMVDLAADIKKRVSIPVIAVCSITPEKGEEILEEGGADFIAFGRQSIADPDFPKKLKNSEPEKIARCLRCNECLKEVMSSNGLRCSVNPEAGQEYEAYMANPAAKDALNIAVVGGGPAGLEAAMTAIDRGHKVTLFEREARLGGALYYAAIPDFKAEFKDYLNYLVHTVENSDVEIRMNTDVTAADLEDAGYDKVILATGAAVSVPQSVSVDAGTVYDPLDVLDSRVTIEADEILVAGGGLVGCEVAMFLAQQGKQVTIIDLLDGIAPGTAIYNKWVIQATLHEMGIKVVPHHRITSMNGTTIIADDLNAGTQKTMTAGATIACLGSTPNDRIYMDLTEARPDLHVTAVGDINGARMVIDAVEEGYAAARLA